MPRKVKQAMSDAGLHLVSAHYGSDDLHQKLDEILAFSKEVGVSYIICSYPGFKDPSRVKNIPAKERSNAFTLADWRWNAEQFNTIGAKVAAAGLQFVGLGDPNALSWGTMLYWAQSGEALNVGSPLWAIMPGVCVAANGLITQR